MKKQSNGSEDLVSKIGDRKNITVEEIPRVREAKKQLEKFKAKGADGEKLVKKLEDDLARSEEEIGSRVLSGGSASVAILTDLRKELSEAGDQARIMTGVIQKAELATVRLKEEVAKELSKKNHSLFVSALAELNAVLQSAIKEIVVVRTAFDLQYLHGIHYHVEEQIRDLEQITQQLAKQEQYVKETISKMESEVL